MKKSTVFLIATAVFAALNWWMIAAICATGAFAVAVSKKKG